MKDNELIARFMGIEYKKDHTNTLWWNYDQLHLVSDRLIFNTSWDWLMPVVEKIEKLHSANFKYDMDQITSGNWPKDNEYMQVIAAPLATPIGEVYEKIIDFIKWYNTKL